MTIAAITQDLKKYFVTEFKTNPRIYNNISVIYYSIESQNCAEYTYNNFKL